MDATTYEWSPAERFVSGAALCATSPTVDVQSVPRFMQLSSRQAPGNCLQGKPCLPYLDYVGSLCKFFPFRELTPKWTRLLMGGLRYDSQGVFSGNEVNIRFKPTIDPVANPR